MRHWRNFANFSTTINRFHTQFYTPITIIFTQMCCENDNKLCYFKCSPAIQKLGTVELIEPSVTHTQTNITSQTLPSGGKAVPPPTSLVEDTQSTYLLFS